MESYEENKEQMDYLQNELPRLQHMAECLSQDVNNVRTKREEVFAALQKEFSDSLVELQAKKKEYIVSLSNQGVGIERCNEVLSRLWQLSRMEIERIKKERSDHKERQHVLQVDLDKNDGQNRGSFPIDSIRDTLEQTLQKKIHTTSKTLEEITTKNKELEEKIKILEAEKRTFLSDRERLRSQHRSLEEETSDLEKILRTRRQFVVQQERSLKFEMAIKMEAEFRENLAKGELKKLNDSLSSASELTTSSKLQVEEETKLTEEIKVLQSENDLLNRRIRRFEKERADFQSKLAKASSEIDAAHGQMYKSSDLEAKLKSLKEEETKKDKKVIELRAKLKELREIDVLSQTLLHDNRKLHEELENRETRLFKLLRDNHDLEIKLENQKEILESKESEFKNISTDQHGEKTLLREKWRKIQMRFNSTLDELKNGLDEPSFQLSSIIAKHKALHSCLRANMNSLIDDFTIQFNEASSQLAEERNKTAHLEMSIEEMKSKLNISNGS